MDKQAVAEMISKIEELKTKPVEPYGQSRKKHVIRFNKIRAEDPEYVLGFVDGKNATIEIVLSILME